MSQDFTKGVTNNHLTFVMVDATDFATPESALSAAIKIYVYGKVVGSSAVFFVSSGTGSMSGGDIKHVGASKFGAYTVALTKPDLSDASNAWYDQYTFHMSAAGAAHQTIIVDGGIFRSFLSQTESDVLSTLGSQFAVVSNYLSNASNYLSSISAISSDAHSAAILGASNASDAASYALVIQSRLSDFQSVYESDISDVLSAVRGNSDALSDLLSRLNSGSFLSDIASHVWAAKYTANSAASSFGSLMSDIYSRAGGAVTASDISDIASAVWATALATKLVQLNTSDLSDLRSAIAAGPAATVTASDISDIASAVWAAKYTAHSAASSFGSMMSDIYSKVTLIQSTASDAHSAALLAASAASDAHSAALLTQSMISDVDSALTSQFSDVTSKLGGTLNANVVQVNEVTVSGIGTAGNPWGPG